MKITILYSGGLDSFFMYEYAKRNYPNAEINCIYYKHGADSEKQEILRLPGFVQIRKVEWLNKFIKPVAKKDDEIAGAIYIAGRNLVFSVLASCQEISDEVWMGTLWDEDHETATDKNEKFRSGTSALLSYVLSPFIDEVKVRFPFVEKGWSKLECVQWALSVGISKEAIADTVSCWNYKADACGECKQCFKRNLIFLLMGIKEEYVVDPCLSQKGRLFTEYYLSKNNPNKDEQIVKQNILKCRREGLLDGYNR